MKTLIWVAAIVAAFYLLKKGKSSTSATRATKARNPGTYT